MRKKIVCAALAAAMSMTLLAGCGSNSETTTAAATEAATTATTAASTEAKTEVQTEAVTEEATEAYKPEEPDEYVQYPDSAAYHLVWEENFDQPEKKLSADDWNYEAHKAGWVNHELQAYVNTEEYAYVQNGELVIRPKKEVSDDGKITYTSGRVNTSRKHDFKYGLIEAKIKVPTGKGFLPAFWMLPTQTSLYGSWPRCGEIDIMEVVTNDPSREYGSIHFGDPHGQRQGSVADGSNYSEEYHVLALEWEPGLIRWYVDGKAFYETSDWFTASNGEEKPYPAPFDQDFHVILNVAVGGDWPGDPDPDLTFDENTNMYVDYVRVYQKDSYDENVEKPAKEMHMKDPDASGNYINNGDFAAPENLNDDQDWVYQSLNKGVGAAEIKDGEMIIGTTNEGTETYSIQLVQGGLPMEKGQKYKLSFDAYAEDARKMIVAITGPNVEYKRYLEDTSMDLGKDWKTYSFDFEMKEDSDDNGRLEYDLGKQGSTATVHIRNVRLEKAN